MVIIIGATSIFFVLKPKQDSEQITPPNLISPTTTPISLSTWTDEAGFSFQYPTGTTIDKHPEDNINYANLTLTFLDNSTAQITMSDKTSTNTATATFTDNDVVVTVTGNKDLIVNSWQFIYPTPTIGKTPKVNTSQSDSDNVLEEE